MGQEFPEKAGPDTKESKIVVVFRKNIKGEIMRKIITVFLSFAMVMMMSLSAFAASISQDAAVDTALADAGLTKEQVTGLQSEKDGNKFEIEFIQTSNGTDFDYEISASDGKLIDKSVDYRYDRNKSKKKIGKKAARKKAAAAAGVKYKTVKKGTCKYKYKKKQGKYTVKFKSKGYRYEVDILAPTGQVIEFDKELIKR